MTMTSLFFTADILEEVKATLSATIVTFLTMAHTSVIDLTHTMDGIFLNPNQALPT